MISIAILSRIRHTYATNTWLLKFTLGVFSNNLQTHLKVARAKLLISSCSVAEHADVFLSLYAYLYANHPDSYFSIIASYKINHLSNSLLGLNQARI